MARVRYLKNAPITEALIDLRVSEPAERVEFEDREDRLKGCPESLGDEYPQRFDMYVAHLEFRGSVKDGVQTGEREQGLRGYKFVSTDEKQIVQFRLDGFTFSRLKPYEDWMRLRDETKRLWFKYEQHMRPPQKIRRVALRYINHVEIPIGKEADEFLPTGPRLPSDTADRQAISSFLSRVIVSDRKYDAQVGFTQARDESKPAAEGFARILIDIDVFRTGSFSHGEVWDILQGFHDLKNEMFFSSIGEPLAEKYE